MRYLLYIAILSLFLGSCKNGHVLDITSFSLQEHKTFSFGGKGDIILPGLPDTVLEISSLAGANGLHWKMRHPVYVKFDNKTVNRVNVDTVSWIRIDKYTITNDQLKECSKRFTDKDNVAYIALKDILTYYYSSAPADLAIYSIFACDKESNVIILLDTITTLINSNLREIKWQNTGVIPASQVNIAFFRTFRFTPVNFTNTDNFFSKGDTSYISRVKPLHNSFGADRISLALRADGKQKTGYKWEVHLNKKYRFVFPDELFSDTISGDYYVCQELAGYKPGSYIYTDNFSAGFPDILGKVDSTKRFIPAENVSLQYKFYRSGISFAYIIRYSPLLLICIGGLILYFLFFGKKSDAQDFFHEMRPDPKEVRNWRNYYIIITTCLFILLNFREFIGYNLSYSYPYFPFSYDVAATVSPVILLSVQITYLLFWKYNFRNAFSKPFRIIVAALAMSLLLYNAWLSRDIYRDVINDARENGLGLQSYHAGILVISIYCCSAIALYSGLLFFIERIFTKVIYRGKNFNVTIGQSAGIVLLIALASIFFLQDNAASTFIIPWMLIAHAILRKWKGQSELVFERNVLRRLGWFFVRSLIIFGPPAVLLLLVKKDIGYLITLPLYMLVFWLIVSVLYKYYGGIKTAESKKLRWNTILGTSLVFLVIIGLFYSFSRISASYTPGDSERFNARVTAMYNFESIREYGYNETEQIAQFFAVMGMYGIPQEHNTFEPIHKSVSSFTDPVVKNDLSVLFGLIYSSGKWWSIGVIVLVCVLFLLLWQGIKMAIFPTELDNNYEYFLTGYGELRLLSTCVICGTAIWLLLSYYGLLPFTGRLLYGLGQDSLGEVIETTAWFSIMGLAGNLNLKKRKQQ